MPLYKSVLFNLRGRTDEGEGVQENARVLAGFLAEFGDTPDHREAERAAEQIADAEGPPYSFMDDDYDDPDEALDEVYGFLLEHAVTDDQ
jgi:hypothetical protein